MKPPVPTERHVQRGILRMMSFCFRDALVHHSPNGAHLAGSKTARFKQAGALMGDGMRRGFPDLLVLWAPGKAAFMEVKRPGGKPELHQIEMHHKLRALGFPVAVVTSQGEAYQFLIQCGVPQSAELLVAA
jgi:hypothetical protein